MANTYEAISKTVLTSSAASVNLTGIPSTYTDLLLTYSGRSTFAGVQDENYLRVNADSSTANYSYTYLRGNGSTATSGRTGTGSLSALFVGWIPGSTATSNTFGNCEIYLPNYTGSTKKSVSTTSVSETNATGAYIELDATLYQGTAAITSLLFIAGFGSFATGSSFYLYGIKNS